MAGVPQHSLKSTVVIDTGSGYVQFYIMSSLVLLSALVHGFRSWVAS